MKLYNITIRIIRLNKMSKINSHLDLELDLRHIICLSLVSSLAGVGTGVSTVCHHNVQVSSLNTIIWSSRRSVTSQNNHIWKWIISLYPYMANSWRHKPSAFHACILQISSLCTLICCGVIKICWGVGVGEWGIHILVWKGGAISTW